MLKIIKLNRILINNKQKIFCVGFNKTGTTSLEMALGNLGFTLGNQGKGELLFSNWRVRNFDEIIKLSKTADVFQDIPFSLPFTFQTMDINFPHAKFILTIRDTPEQWFQSLTTFHSKIINGNSHLPTTAELKNYSYHYSGFIWDILECIFNADEELPYDEKKYIDCYNQHNTAVIEYFKNKPGKLLVLNVSDVNSMQKLYEFLNIQWNGEIMPHLNKT